MLQIKNLRKSIQSKQILQDISFTLTGGQIALFLGGSGVGKSTLLRVINNLETYDSGDIYLHNKPLRENVGLVFQHFNLFENLSVEENITLGLCKTKKKSRCEAKALSLKLLSDYGLLDKAQSTVQTLSGGQKQRLAIARTLALNPTVVCFDEPTSALDPEKTRQVAQCIKDIARDNKIVLVSTHDMQLLSLLDAHIFYMKDGTIAQSVASKCFLKTPEKYTDLQQFLGMTTNA